MRNQLFFFLIFAFLICSCDYNKVFMDYKELDKGIWQVSDTLVFEFAQKSSIKVPHHIFFNVRNDDTYKFSNLFIISKLVSPTGKISVDTLEYQMANPDGSWLGSGLGSLKESKLWYKENIKLSDSGVYTFKVTHAMRQNGIEKGLHELNGILDFGIEIQTAN